MCGRFLCEVDAWLPSRFNAFSNNGINTESGAGQSAQATTIGYGCRRPGIADAHHAAEDDGMFNARVSQIGVRIAMVVSPLSRRMADGAAHPVDPVLPRAAI